MEEKIYKPTALSRMLGLNLVTVAQRFTSKYAKERWGVKTRKRADGSIERFVPESSLPRWKENIKYVGRPVFKDKEEA